jgi:hypothetical protein
MTQQKTLHDFAEYLVPNAAGKKVRLIHFFAGHHNPRNFELVFRMKTTCYSTVTAEVAVLPMDSASSHSEGNIAHLELLDVPADRNLYVQVRPVFRFEGKLMTMSLDYRIL